MIFDTPPKSHDSSTECVTVSDGETAEAPAPLRKQATVFACILPMLKAQAPPPPLANTGRASLPAKQVRKFRNRRRKRR